MELLFISCTHVDSLTVFVASFPVHPKSERSVGRSHEFDEMNHIKGDAYLIIICTYLIIIRTSRFGVCT